jgi:hypothetical protein
MDFKKTRIKGNQRCRDNQKSKVKKQGQSKENRDKDDK